MYGIVYEARNTTNGKFYVGQTIQSLVIMKASHYSHAKSNAYDSYFIRALKKYKKTDWEWKVLGRVDCQFGLDILEKSWIWIKDSMSPGGYNTREAGSSGKFSEEARRAVSKGLKGKKKKPFTKEHCEKK